MAHEIAHAFTSRHPSKHLFAAGFGEGWSDLAIAYTGERLGFLGGPLEKTWPNWRDGSEFRAIRDKSSRSTLRAAHPSACGIR